MVSTDFYHITYSAIRLSLGIWFCIATCLISCRSEVAIPESRSTSEAIDLFPDYRDIVIPPNIAPLNFQVKNPCEICIAQITAPKGTPILTESDHNGKIYIAPTAWQQLIHANRGRHIQITIYTRHNEEWLKHPAYKIYIAREPIDSFLSYRLLEPSYELYRQLGLYQRNLTNFEEWPIYENNSTFDSEDNHCVNCHNYQNSNTDRMLFHVRAAHGGTVFVHGDSVEHVDMKCDSVLGGSVYPAWHPTQPWVVFSSNKTGQAFHMTNPEKVEVIDFDSDLLFYDVDRHRLSNIFRTPSLMETFPAWSPDGNTLYYCVAPFPKFSEIPDSLRDNADVRQDLVIGNYHNVRYNIMSIPFDARSRTFGTPHIEIDCAQWQKSGTLPRISPDGRYLLFTLGDFGQFHIWHKSSDLWVKRLSDGHIYPLTKANSNDVDSYHTWSTNGRWIVFSSRRLDGNYTRPFIAYFDTNGQAHKAFLLPQEDPEQNWLRLKSYNVPELTRHRVKISPEKFKTTIYDDQHTGHVKYGK